jgi:signal transduction histidine kinase/CheY-like chemotaxis protein
MAANYGEKLKTIELQQTVDRLQQDVNAASNAIDNQNNIIILLCVGIIIFGFLCVALYLRVRAQRRNIVKLKETANSAQRSLESREKFVAFVNHEIRTPLNAVSGSATLLQKTELNERQARYVRTIQASVQNVLVLVNDVLDLSRAESGKVEFRSVDFLIRELLNGISYILQEKVESKGIELEVVIDENVPDVLVGDSAHLNQIILNLANNAVKFTDLGKVSILVDLLKPADENLWVRFRIVDTGKGIRKSKLNSIFNQFEQETRHTIKHSGGSGLGLAITRQLVEKQGGKIYVDSKYMEGSVFTVELSFKKGDVERAMTGRRKDKIDSSVLTGMHILVVDDNEMNREILRDLLLDLNDQVRISLAESAALCYPIIAEQEVSVVLMDIQMPEIDGFEASRYIRNKMPAPVNEVPIIAMTAHALDDVSTRCFEAGMTDYISKPIDLSFLITKIERLVERKRIQNRPSWKYIDLLPLSTLAGGDKEKVLRYIQLFVDQAPGDIEAIRLAVEDKDFEKAGQILHKIKGTIGYFGDDLITELYLKYSSMTISEEGLLELFRQATFRVENVLNELRSVLSDHKLLFLSFQVKQ